MTRVLVVGADSAPVGALREALLDAGARLGRAPDAAAALDELAASTYDCVVVGDLPSIAPDRLEGHLNANGHALPVVRADGRTPEETATRALEAAETHRLEAARDRRRRVRDLLADVRAALPDCEDPAAVERATCDALADSSLYWAAWVGRWDDARGVVVPAAAAGIERETLREVPAGDGSPVAGRVPVEWTPAAEVDGDHVVVAVPVIGEDPVGVLQVYADRPGGVDDVEQSLLADLGEAVGAAVARVTPDDGADADADGLEVLGDTLAHELGNQLDAARVQLELARERDDDGHLERVEGALERIESVASDAKALARGTLDPGPRRLSAAAEEAWAAVETRDATLSVEEGSVEADPDLLGLLLENLFRNAVEHGSTSSQPAAGDAVEHGSTSDRPEADGAVEHGGGVTVRVGELADGEGFYVEDDGEGIPEEERDAVFEWGYTTRASSGAGLGIVSVVADRHGWTVDLRESDEGGARFELRP